MAYLEFEGIKVDKEGKVAIVTLNRPEKLNPMTRDLVDNYYPEVFNTLRTDDGVRVVIITGAGRAFCAGADLSGLKVGRYPGRTGPTWQRLRAIAGDFANSLYNLEKPTIAAVNGVAAGGGCAMTLLCDIRIASDKARFMLAYILRGLIPDIGATTMLPRLIGMGKALELMYTGKIIDAQEALSIGLVNKVVPHDQLMTEAKSLAEELAKKPPLALGMIKKAAHAGLYNTLDEQVHFESYAQNFLFHTKDHEEGIKAFFEKREANFLGE